MNLSITVEGLVTASQWNELGIPIEVKLSTPSERDFYVVNNSLGYQLFHFLKTWVVVTGVVCSDGGAEYIQIHKINKTNVL